MKKILLIKALLLSAYILILLNQILLPEIFLIYFFPLVLVGIVALIISLLVRFFRKQSFLRVMKSIFIISLVFQTLVLSIISWSIFPRMHYKEDIVKDIDFAIKTMEDVHPNLYAYTSKNDFDQKVDSIKNSLQKKESETKVFKIFCEILSSVQDAHTMTDFTFPFKRGAFIFRKTLPYKFKVKGDRIFIEKNHLSKKSVPIGSEVLSINDKTSPICIKEMENLISFENEPWRNMWLSTPIFWSLWNNFKDYSIRYKSSIDSTINTLKASGGLLSKHMFVIDLPVNSENYMFRIINDSIALIEFNKCRNLNEFKSFLDSAFKEINKTRINNIIIDIRKNGGGNSSLGDEFMQYISTTEFRPFDLGQVKVSEQIIQAKKLNHKIIKNSKIGQLFTFIDTTIKLRDNPLRFNGNLFLLIGGNTFSSGASFASQFQCFTDGKIIGSETGGLTACYGGAYKLVLPKTKIPLRVSFKKFINPCGEFNKRGIIPDFEIENSFEDINNNVDRVLEFTLGLISQE